MNFSERRVKSPDEIGIMQKLSLRSLFSMRKIIDGIPSIKMTKNNTLFIFILLTKKIQS